MKKYLATVNQKLKTEKPINVIWVAIMVLSCVVSFIFLSIQNPKMNFWQILMYSFFLGVILTWMLNFFFYFCICMVNMFFAFTQILADLFLLRRIRIWLRSKEIEWDSFVERYV